ncbi:hypothetical protein JZ751_008921 [Albula glossodonta]|uniref:Histidine ammonia-lyase n=1 Tax=Albula glossodonta TaxID=121402 RepID=A0A8T2P214_9TELE|nr:hypothetical protein JZ751_008921 [Albula glossodonta]
MSCTGQNSDIISLDGNSLTTADLVCLGKGLTKIKLTPEAEQRVKRSREVIETIIKENKVVYGVNTGFGKFANTVIPKDKLKELQENLIRSHAAGVGSPLSPERTRMLLALRINVLAKGHSGVSMETLQAMIEAFNASCLSLVPEKGTVGASGDLAPLSHLTLGLMGEGQMWSPKSGWGNAKEGLALNNGTQLITSLGAEAVERAQAIARQADIVAALTLEVLKGTTKAFDSDIHAVRPHPGQNEAAWRFRSVLDSDIFPSQITENNRPHQRVQDAYSLRCSPQVHGVANDTIAFVKQVLTIELNSATDNPALDMLAIGVHELSSISERRIERLCNPSLSELPAFLVNEGGLNSGFMIAHCTAAALVSENKVLCHPSSVDSLSTSAATEDHVSMGGWAARKALRVVEHVEQVLAIELLAACQALEFHRPLKTTPPLEKVYALVRTVTRPWDKDRVMSPDIEAVHKLLKEEQSAPLFPSLNPLGSKPAAPMGTDMELQKMLIDERMRCENHKTNYQTLKAEHTRLQGEYTRAQDELKRSFSDKQSVQEKHQLLLAELQGELLDKTRELEELRMQILTPQKLELLRAQIQQELEGPVRERFNKLEEETEKYRSEFNKLRYEYTFLKSEFEHQREEHARVLEERKIRFDAEISRLEKDKEELTAQLLSSDPSRDSKRVEALLRDKAQLHLRLKGLEAEVAELRAERDSCGAQAENVQRIQVRQLAESQAAVKALEAEKQSLRLQLERLESELRLSQEQNTQLTTRLHKAEREVNVLTSQVEQMKHSHKLEVANVKLESVRARGELERERDVLQSQVEGLQLDVEVLKETVERSKELLVEKEREVIRRVQAAREEEFHKMAAVQEEKLELENRMSELEQQRALQEATGTSQKEEWEERLRAAQLGEETARREVQSLRTKVQQQSLQLEELGREKQENADLRQRNQELNLQVGTLSHSEGELLEANHRLRETLERLKEELRNARAQAEKAQLEAERMTSSKFLFLVLTYCHTVSELLPLELDHVTESGMLEERRVEWLEEKHKLQERDTELQEKYSQAKERLQRAALAQKKVPSHDLLRVADTYMMDYSQLSASTRKTMSENKEKKLQDKIQLLEAKIAELEFETRTANNKNEMGNATSSMSPYLQRSWPLMKPAHSEEQAHLHRRLKELQRRHSEFRRLLLGTQHTAGSAFIPVPGAEAPFASLHDAEDQRELAVLRRRLEELESSQQQQLEELGPPLERDLERPQL